MYQDYRLFGFVTLIFGLVCSYVQKPSLSAPPQVSSVRILLTVNDTWDEKGCIQTVLTNDIIPGKRSRSVQVGSCDEGPLEVSVRNSSNGMDKMNVHVLFHSSVIEDASPPECDIAWNGTYLSPHQPEGVFKANRSLLPGCWTAESREGYHMTYYWFHLFDWKMK